MINAVYRDKPLIFIGATFREKLLSHHQAVNIKLLSMFKFIKAVSDSVFSMINACIVYRDKPLIFIGATFREKLLSHHQAVNIKLLSMFKFIKAVSDSVFSMINACIVYRDKPLIFIGATFREKLLSHHRSVNEADSCLHMRPAGLC